jgi:Bacterial Ig domain
MVDTETPSRPAPGFEWSDSGPTNSPSSGWRSWLIPAATVVGFAVPVVSYLWMIHAYGVNVVFADQWDDVALIGHAHSGTLHFSTLWAQHYENRIFFPNLIVLALAYTTHFNVLTEEYLSAFMLFGATALVIGAHRRRSPGRRLIWYCPVAFLMLSLAQAGNALWGFQMAWYLVLLMTTVALFLLDHEPQRWPVFGAAIAAAIVASFSSLQGLLVWPAGLLLIYLRRRDPRLGIVWTGFALVTGVIYFLGFNFNVAQTASQNPSDILSFFVRVVGDVVGEGQPGALVTLFGAVMALTAIWVLVRFVVRERTTPGGRPFALSLILFGLLFSALTAVGRSSFNFYGFEVEDRYTVFAIFVFVGLYLAVLDPPVSSEVRATEDGDHTPARGVDGRLWSSDSLFTLVRVIVGAGIALTVIFGSVNGLSQARAVRQNRLYLGQVTVRASQYPNTVVNNLDWLETARTVRDWVAVARKYHLSLFGTGDAAKYLSEKPLDLYSTPLRATIDLPANGSTLHGRHYLDVAVSDQFDVTKVDYFLTGPGRQGVLFATGSYSAYGWLHRWNTATVPNGTYSITATVRDSGGRTVTTPPIEVHVQNSR